MSGSSSSWPDGFAWVLRHVRLAAVARNNKMSTHSCTKPCSLIPDLHCLTRSSEVVGRVVVFTAGAAESSNIDLVQCICRHLPGRPYCIRSSLDSGYLGRLHTGALRLSVVFPKAEAPGYCGEWKEAE